MDADQLIGQTIGNYLVTQKLGEGGMGSVYLAEHPTIGKKVALKVLHGEYASNHEVVARFFNEAKAVNDIGHPNIVDIVDFGVLQGGAGREQLVYFIMEYLAGQSVAQLVRTEAPLPPERAVGLALQVADALSASHKCGIVHRDLKPDNIILVTRARERDFVKLLDFGIAKLTNASSGSSRTRTGVVMGTPAYMSPEQCDGKGLVDQRTDIYALGILLYELLTGRVPFIGEGYGDILVQHLTQRPVPPSQLRMLPPHVEVVVLKALEKRPDLRYPTMEEFMRAMADPYGYVEAHGGLQGFLGWHLMPSSVPLELPNRLSTPVMQMTPPPGTLTPVPGTANPSVIVAPSSGRSRVGFWIAGMLVIAGAVGGIVVVVGMGKRSGGEVPGTGSGTGSGAVVAAVGSGSGSGSAAGSNGSGSAGAGSAIVVVPTAGSGSGSAVASAVGSGSAAVLVAVGSGSAAGSGSGSAVTIARDVVALALESTPPGAEVFLDGKDQHAVTPCTLHVPHAQKATVLFKLDGYDDRTRDLHLDGDDVDASVTLEKHHHHAVPVPTPHPTPHHDADGTVRPGDI